MCDTSKSKFFEDSLEHNPKLKLQNVENGEKIIAYLEKFLLTKEQMCKMKQVFIEEMKLGSMRNPPKKSSLMMMNTYVTNLIDGSETGDFLALDLGSTNFRVCHLNLQGSKENLFDVQYYDIPEHIKIGKADPLFDHIALCVKDFIENVLRYDREKQLPLGFTFSFPMINKSIDCGILTTWTKSYDIPEVVGHNPAEFLQRALDKHKVKCKVEALINDATGTLMKGIHSNRDCKLGVILGTGFNICYCENNCDRLENWQEERKAKYSDVNNVFVDIECGAFGDTGCIDFVKTDIDYDLDNDSLFPKSFSFEKMFAGKFYGQIVARILRALVQKGLLLNGKITSHLENNNFLRSRTIQQIDSDETVKTAEETLNQLGYSTGEYNIDDLITFKHISRVVALRCACLVSPLFAAIIDWLNEPNTVIAIDGSFYKHHVVLKKFLRDYTAELTDRKKMFDLILASDGSGKGGALTVAACLKKNRN